MHSHNHAVCPECKGDILLVDDIHGNQIGLDPNVPAYYKEAFRGVFQQVSNARVEHKFVCPKRGSKDATNGS
jgi:uncharacterized protein YbaR (Trm112 family)